jgi:hypothetical protein
LAAGGLALLLALLPVLALAQNAAEGKPPPASPDGSAAAVDDTTAAEGQPDDAAANTAEGAAKAKPGEKPAGTPPTKPAPNNPPPPPGTAQPAGAPPPGGSAPPPNAAEGKATTPGTAPAAQPSGVAPGPGIADVAQGPAAPPIRVPGTRPNPDPNAAEGRTPGGAALNSADTETKPAEPPVPDYMLPTPNEAAGPAAGYTPPEMHLDVPGIEPLPEPEGLDTFQQPARDYLQQRPLPPVSETETDEERAARDIEQSLKEINLAKENRSAEPIKLPLPGGQVAFKAADSFTYDRKNRVLTFTGNSELWFDKMLVAADYIQVDDGAATAYAKGYVMVQQADEVVYADEMYLNYDTGHLELFNVEGNTGGNRLQNGVVYFMAEHVYGTWDHMIMERTQITTCDPFCGQTREVHLSARKVVFKRDRSIVLRDVHTYIRTHKVAWMPVLAFPLVKQKQRFNQHETEIQQNYGFDTQNGWYAKFAYTYYTHYVEKANAELLGVVKGEFVENAGPGLGLRQDFYIPALGVTTIRGFYQQDWPKVVADNFLGRNLLNAQKNFEFELKQELNLSHSLHGNLSSNRVNRFTPSTVVNGNGSRTDSWTSNFSLQYAQKDTAASITGSQTVNTTGGQLGAGGTQLPRTQSINSNASFSYSQTLGKDLKFKLDDQYTSTKGGGSTSGIPADQEGTFSTSLDYTFQDKQDTSGYSSAPRPATADKDHPGTAPLRHSSPLDGLHATLEYREQGIDYDQNRNTRDNNNQITKALPELKVDLPRDLINDRAYFTQFRVEMGNLVTGRRRDPQSSFRFNLHAGGNGNMRFSRDTNLNSTTAIDQYWYDDGNSQYNINQNLSYNYTNHHGFDFSSSWALNFHQGVRQPPVISDRRIYSQTTNYGIRLTNYRSWRWQLQSGFNLATYRHNPLTTTFSWDPNKTFSFIHSASYDIENTNWNFSSFQGSWRSPYIDERGIYNWAFNTSVSVDTDYAERWAITQLQMSYFRRYERGWSTEITGGYRAGGTNQHAPEFSEDFLRNMIKTVTIRKVNCCTTLEGSWSATNHSFDLKMYLNALPQYPGTLDDSRGQRLGTVPEGLSPYVYQPQFLFPTDNLRTDILSDMFGITGTTF